LPKRRIGMCACGKTRLVDEIIGSGTQEAHAFAASEFHSGKAQPLVRHTLFSLIPGARCRIIARRLTRQSLGTWTRPTRVIYSYANG
jgi:hypothetical protein